ncbi:hypothetical protein J2Y55_005843 [Bosea sp. BE125]|uniref:hypothetical protein n=1 Tax=Bosea sp. BE125 TaxID=2817909 RepID=UPI002861966A|nr:hypothetical protein [Bosea sp. BE125]MDR6874805.1 hypothetical protein [Bosea sp. BE125]
MKHRLRLRAPYSDGSGRWGKVETDIQLLGANLENLGQDLKSFRREWSEKAEEDRAAHKSARLTMPQIVGMIGTAVVVTSVLFGGLIFLVNGQIATVRLDLASQLAQVTLSVRGQGDAITALNTAQQQAQRDMAADRVKLGLVEQSAAMSSRFIDQAQSFDAVMARHEERIRSQDERMRALEKLLRELAARRPAPP